jgi:hypothetical protein
MKNSAHGELVEPCELFRLCGEILFSVFGCGLAALGLRSG